MHRPSSSSDAVVAQQEEGGRERMDKSPNILHNATTTKKSLSRASRNNRKKGLPHFFLLLCGWGKGSGERGDDKRGLKQQCNLREESAHLMTTQQFKHDGGGGGSGGSSSGSFCHNQRMNEWKKVVHSPYINRRVPRDATCLDYQQQQSRDWAEEHGGRNPLEIYQIIIIEREKRGESCYLYYTMTTPSTIQFTQCVNTKGE